MKRYTIELGVGVFVFITLLCVGYLAINLGKMEFIGDNYYTLYARFDTVGGLRAGSTVQLAGVDIGQVDDIELDLERYTAIVELRIQNGVVITDDSIASVKTSGLIGDKYLNISPGAGDPLNPGDTMIETEPPLDIEDLIGRYIFGGVEDGGGDELDFE